MEIFASLVYNRFINSRGKSSEEVYFEKIVLGNDRSTVFSIIQLRDHSIGTGRSDEAFGRKG